MTWFKVDDGFWSHPKTSSLSDNAVALWARAGSYCSQHLTDGFVKTSALRFLGKRAAVDELVGAGLWHQTDDGWEFHDWDQYQETSDVVKKRRHAARDRQRRFREMREDSRDLSRRDSDVTNADSHAVSSQPPTRPDPTIKERTTTDVVVPKKATLGTRLPDTWTPRSEVVAQMRSDHPHIDLKAEHAKFIDYWQSKPGKDARKTDWDATWRNWIRRAAEQQPSARAPNGSSQRSTVDQKVNGWRNAVIPIDRSQRELE